MDDLIRRQDAIDAAKQHWYKPDIAKALEDLPPAYPDRLTDDDFETIRIHLNAHKEALCNQHRWEEAEEYQRIIDRFVAFATVQPEIIRCKNCAWWQKEWSDERDYHYCIMEDDRTYREFYCADAERRTDD